MMIEPVSVPADSEIRVRDIMQTGVVTISAGDTLSTVEDIMTLGGLRHIPVVRGGTLVGVVSERDLLRASLSNLTFPQTPRSGKPPGCLQKSGLAVCR